MTRVGASLASVGIALLALASTPRAQPAGEALVIGNGTYGSLPGLSACLPSAHAVTSALRNLGFRVVEREDVSTGATDAAIAEFSRQLAAAPGAAAFAYSCGYATAFNDRPFLLPVSVRITRPADVLTQGVLAKTIVDAIARGGAGSAVVVLDTVPIPDAPAALHFEALTQGSLPAGLGLLSATQERPPDAAPTPLAAALIAALKGPEVQVAPLLASLGQAIRASRSVTIAGMREPVAQGYLAGAPPPAPPPSVSPSPPATAAVPVTVPAEEQMSEADRRAVQIALARIGYYDGRIDGVFGPESRAAIRRYQHELGADLTGRLSADQAGRLLGSR